METSLFPKPTASSKRRQTAVENVTGGQMSVYSLQLQVRWLQGKKKNVFCSTSCKFSLIALLRHAAETPQAKCDG